MARDVGITSWTSTANLVAQLRNVPFQRLVDAQRGWTALDVPRGFYTFDWAPCAEPANSPETRFLTDTPWNLMNTGNFLRMPFIVGYTDVESLFTIREVLIDDTVMDQFIAQPHLWSPHSFNLNRQTQQAEINEVATTFRNIYFNGQNPGQNNRFNWTQYMTDAHFTFGTDRTIRYHATRQTQPIYYYKFSMDGSLNMVKRLLLLSSYDGAVHADDIFYLFDVSSWPMPILPGNIALTVRRRMVRLWTNFAIHG